MQSLDKNSISVKILFFAFDMPGYYSLKVAKLKRIDVDLLKAYYIIAVIFFALIFSNFLSYLFIYLLFYNSYTFNLSFSRFQPLKYFLIA